MGTENATVPVPRDTLAPRPTVLVVDDERLSLDAIERHLEEDYHVVTASDPASALARLERETSIAVVVCDQSMPGMRGSELLMRARVVSPDCVRIMLTGGASLDNAVRAINDGHVFRFLIKPCPPEALRAAVSAAVRQHQLQIAERELLEETVTGAVQMLRDIVDLTRPDAGGGRARFGSLAMEIARRLDEPDLWELEVAAHLVSAGLGGTSSDDESASPVHEALVGAAANLVARIPRLQSVAELLREFAGGEARSRKAAVLLAVYHYLALRETAQDEVAALEALALKDVPADVIDALRAAQLGSDEPQQIPVSALRVGMVLDRPLRSKAGVVVMQQGQLITELVLQCIQAWPAGFVESRAVIRGDTAQLQLEEIA